MSVFQIHLNNNRLGPLITSWCMHMEAKNSYFKQVARRHQKLLCAYLQGRNFFTYDELECGYI